ncbi:MAG: hypothetical protein VX438_01625, partial [Planctomycetota bacterium]|nr:hypothetical protein [Planctomycetota bacterium]
MIVGMIMLVVWPILYWVVSPTGWAYAIALEDQRRGNFESAKKGLLEIVESQPLHATAWYRLGEIAFEEQEFEKSLNYSEKGLAVARIEQKTSIIDLQANSLLALDRGKQAVLAIRQLSSFTSLPQDFETLPVGELIPYMDKKYNRRFLNSLAYVMILGNVEPVQAQKYIAAVIGYFESKEQYSFLTAPYLYERASAYGKARESLIKKIGNLKKELTAKGKIDKRIKQLKTELNSSRLSDEEKEVIRLRLRTQELIAGYQQLFLATTRLQLLNRKLKIESDLDLAAELEEFS